MPRAAQVWRQLHGLLASFGEQAQPYLARLEDARRAFKALGHEERVRMALDNVARFGQDPTHAKLACALVPFLQAASAVGTLVVGLRLFVHLVKAEVLEFLDAAWRVCALAFFVWWLDAKLHVTICSAAAEGHLDLNVLRRLLPRADAS